MARRDRSFIGKGPVYIKVRGAAGGMRAIGNCTAMSFSFDEEEITQPDYTRAGGGSANKVTRVSDVTGSLTIADFSSANLALALRGTAAEVAAGAVADEPHTTNGGSDDEFIPFDHQPDLTQPITVTLTNATACVEGTDYTIENNGLLVIGTGNIDANGILITYTKAAGEDLQALTSGGLEYEVFFNGLNEAQGASLVSAEVYRVKFSPAQDLGLITDEFGALEIGFTALNDPTISGVGLSSVMNIKQVL